MGENSAQGRILCVDDEPNVLRALQRIFIDDDYEIVLASSGEEGLKYLAEEGPFQVVVSDYRMPAMNGVDFLHSVYDRWPETIRIVLSGYADIGAVVSAINEGRIYKFIPKPWDDDELRSTIQECLERFARRENNPATMQNSANANLELEENVQGSTEQQGNHVSTFTFLKNLLAALPVGVVAVDGDNAIVYCNSIAQDLCGECDADGKIQVSCDSRLKEIVTEVRQEKQQLFEIEFHNRMFQVRGNVLHRNEQDTVVLVLRESLEE